MLMFKLKLSNLQLRSNLLPEEYQGESRYRPGKNVLECITVYEIKDINRRNPNLILGRTAEQQREWNSSLFNSSTAISMAEDDRDRAWLEQLAEKMDEGIASLEKHADEEQAFELLCVAESLSAPVLDSTYMAKALVWANRVRKVLERPEYKLSSQMIDDRLTEILGHDQWRRAHTSSLPRPVPLTTLSKYTS
jgi:hypothetical protein